MKPQQPRCGNPRRSQHPAGRRRSYLQSSQGLAAGGELLGRQRYKAPLAFCIGPLMRSLTAAVKHDVAELQSKSAIGEGRTLARWKRNERLRRRQRDKANARQIFGSTKHMETTQVQPGQARIEISAAGDDEVDTRVSDTGLVVVRIGKRGCAVLRHPLHLIRQATRLRTAIAKTQDEGLAQASLCDFGSWEIIFRFNTLRRTEDCIFL